MAELTKNQRGLVALMAESEQNAAQGFSLLASYEQPEDFFEELSRAGMFSPDKNPAPQLTEAPNGGSFLPYWPALGYLTNVAKAAAARRDVALGNELMGVVRAISAYRGPDGNRIDNYYTSTASAEIAGLVPPQCVTIDDIELASVWLNGGWNNDMIVKELDDGLFSSHLREPTEESRIKLARLLEITTALRPSRTGSDLVQKPESLAGAFWLERLLKRHAAELGRIVREPAVSCLMSRVGEAFGVGNQADMSWLNRPAIEDHEQNQDWDYVRASMVEAARDSLQAWVTVEPAEASEHVARMLTSPQQIVRRIGIHTCRVNWRLFSSVFFDGLDQGRFRSGHLHELYLLLAEHFPAMDASRRGEVLAAIASLTEEKQGDDLERARYLQRNWLHAIQGKGDAQADAKFAEVSEGLGRELRDHPDFLSYHQTSVGPGPSPFEPAEIISAALEGRLVPLFDEYEPPSHPLRSPRMALIDSVAEAVAKSPRDFLQYLDWTRPMSRRLQYALLSGFDTATKRAYEAKAHDEVNFIAGPLLSAYHSLLTDARFWSEPIEKNDDYEPNRNWIPPIAVEFVDWLSNKDDLPFDGARRAMSDALVRSALDNTEGLPDADDALTAAINDPRGKAFDAYLSLLLRVCRDADKARQGHTKEWSEFRSVLESELQHGGTGHNEVFALTASHIQQLIYVDADWVARNISLIFPETETRFRAAVIGLGYAKASSKLYSMLSAGNVPARVMFSGDIRGSARERMIERVALSYIWGQEDIDGPLVSRLLTAEHFEDIREMADTVGNWADQALTDDQRERALTLGGRCAAFANEAPEDRKALLAVVAQYLAFQIPPDPRDLGWILSAVPFVAEYHGLHEFMESVVRVAEADPASALHLMQALAGGRPPHYDYEERIERTLRLIAAAGFRVETVRVIDRISANGVLASLLPLYEELTR